MTALFRPRGTSIGRAIAEYNLFLIRISSKRTLAHMIKVTQYRRAYGGATTPCNPSRNKREGRYAGHTYSKHIRSGGVRVCSWLYFKPQPRSSTARWVWWMR
jgi:hypothetical protein